MPSSDTRELTSESSLHHRQQNPVAQPWLTVVGIGDDGWGGLAQHAQAAICAAEMVFGSERHIGHLRKAVDELGATLTASLQSWSVPLLAALDSVIRTQHGRRVVILASGDPMLHGIGVSIAKRLALEEYAVVPTASAMSWACARLGWAVAEVALCSVVSQPFEAIYRYVQERRRVMVYARDGETPKMIARLLCTAGFGQSHITVFAHLGGSAEQSYSARACEISEQVFPDLNLLAIEMVADSSGRSLSLVPGLADHEFQTDGQLSKQEIRALSLSALAPLPGQLLWDIGAGSGSIGIEWLRTDPSNRAIAFEAQPERLGQIRANAARLGVPQLRIVGGSVPQSLADQEPPDAVFIGGGLTAPGLIEAVMQILRPPGRVVVNAVSLESEGLVLQLQQQYGGQLRRIAITRAEPLGTFLGWRPLMPITQWIVQR